MVQEKKLPQGVVSQTGDSNLRLLGEGQGIEN